MTRVAVVGVGSMGKNHVRVYTEMPDADLVAVVDANFTLAEQVGQMYRVPAFSDIRKMVEVTRPEAVSVVVSTIEHFSVGKQLLDYGCHVLVEKPIAATLEDAQKLILTAEQNGRILTVGHIERYNPAIVELKRRLDAGELGQVFQIHTRRLGPLPTRIQDVGVVMDLAPHDLDVMRYLIGSEVTHVYAQTKQDVHPTQEDLFAGMISFRDGQLGLLEINWLTPTKIRELYVTGAKGMFRVNYITQDLFFYENAEANGSSWPALSLLRGVSEGVINQYVIHKKEPLRVELEAFISCVQGNPVPLVNGQDAQMALELAMAMIESAKTGQVKFIRGKYELSQVPINQQV